MSDKNFKVKNGIDAGGAINNVTITAPATGSTLTILNGKTFTANNSITLAGTDGTTITLPSTTGTIPLNNQTFYIGTQAIAINAGSGTITALPGVTSINGATLPSSGTIPNTGQTFYIGTQAITIAQGSGTITALPGVTSVNGTTIPSSATLLTSTSTSSSLTSFGSGATLNNGVLTGTLTANSSVGTNGQVLLSTGTGVQWGNTTPVADAAIASFLYR
jgi:hypothetical protein